MSGDGSRLALANDASARMVQRNCRGQATPGEFEALQVRDLATGTTSKLAAGDAAAGSAGLALSPTGDALVTTGCANDFCSPYHIAVPATLGGTLRSQRFDTSGRSYRDFAAGSDGLYGIVDTVDLTPPLPKTTGSAVQRFDWSNYAGTTVFTVPPGVSMLAVVPTPSGLFGYGVDPTSAADHALIYRLDEPGQRPMSMSPLVSRLVAFPAFRATAG